MIAAAHRRDGADLLLFVRLTPRAVRDQIGGQFVDAQAQPWLQARVTPPADKGRANAALIALLGRALKIAPSSILLETGDTNRLKRLRILDCTPATEQALDTMVSEERTER